MELLKDYDCTIEYHPGKANVVADALSRRYVLLYTLEAKLLGFEQIKELYPIDQDFSELNLACEKIAFGIILGMMASCLRKINYVCIFVL